MAGVFDLETPRDLLAKLGYEMDQLRRDPNNAYHAFNFFVTAEHLLDWCYPGDEREPKRREIRDKEPLLQIVSHLANGAKHFDKLKPHHHSVGASGMIARVPIFWMRISMIPDVLGVFLDGSALAAFGTSWIKAVDLAERVCTYWNEAGRVP